MKTIYKDNIWRQIIHFVKEERWDGEYTRETDLVKDLQLKGDDGTAADHGGGDGGERPQNGAGSLRGAGLYVPS